MTERPEDICPRPDFQLDSIGTRPMAQPIHPATVWACDSIGQAEAILAGEHAGFVYQRTGHPNASVLADKCRELHRADEAIVTGSGMAAIAAVMLSQLKRGDHLVLSHQLYGTSAALLSDEAARFGVDATVVDTCDLPATTAAVNDRTRMIVAETIANPRLDVADVGALAAIARQAGAQLMIDNTFATPLLCRPLERGADWVVESVSKMMNGHSDVMLGLVCGRREHWERMPLVVATWGLASSPLDCYLASRGLATLPLRLQQACDNALAAAGFLHEHAKVKHVDYPGLAHHPQHRLAHEQLGGRYGTIVTFHLDGDRSTADALISAARRIPFSPSLGEVSTTLSHPQSTSHRTLSEDQRQRLGISGATLRLSVGCESSDGVIEALSEALSGIG